MPPANQTVIFPSETALEFSLTTLRQSPYDSDSAYSESKVGNEDSNPLKHGKTQVPYPVWDICTLSTVIIFSFHVLK